MSTAERYDEPRYRYGSPNGHHGYGWRSMHPGWIVLMVLGFIFWWPIGLAILAYIFWSKNMGCHSGERWQHKMQRMEEKMGRMRDRMQGGFGGGWGSPPSSGNHAFDEYRSRDIAPAGRRAARVQGLPRPAALRQGQVRVRPVHV